MRIIFSATLILLLSHSRKTFSQGYLKTDYVSSSAFKEEDKKTKLGSGDMYRVSGAYTLPFSVKKNDSGQITAWSATLSGSYSSMNNNGLAKTLNPNEVLNTSFSILHLRPISEKWSLLSVLGGGVYAEPNNVTWKSLLINGGVIFIYKVDNELDLGFGAGVTNLYGAPMAMPMAYLKWNLSGKYDLTVDMSMQVKVAGRAKFSDKFHLQLTGLEVEGMAAVTEMERKSMIYSSAIIKSYLSPEFKFGNASTLYLGVGAVQMRYSKMSERTIKSFWKSIGDEKLYFNPGFYAVVGYKYGF